MPRAVPRNLEGKPLDKIGVEVPPGKPVAWAPWEGAQTAFLECDAFESLYGGAAGGGKSDCLLAECLRGVEHKSWKAIYFRRTSPELQQEIIPRAEALIRSIEGLEKSRWNGQYGRWTFPSGARLTFSHLEQEKDKHKHRSAEYTLVAFDELTTFTEGQYRFLISRLRNSHGLECFVRAGTNPGGPGHEWVFKRWRPWLDPHYKIPNWQSLGLSGPRPAPGEKLWYLTHPETGEDIWVPPGTPGALSRCFHPAKLEDNPALEGTGYEEKLNAQDPLTRKQLRGGDWLAKAGPKTFFNRDWMPVVPSVPLGGVVRRVRFWDRAATEPWAGNPDPDWTVGLRLAFSEETGLYYVEDMIRFRAGPGRVKQTVCDTAKADGVEVCVGLTKDPAQAGVFEVNEYLNSLQGFAVELLPEKGDKITRAKAVSAQVAPRPGQQVGIFRVVDGPWNAAFFAQVEDFPEGKKDVVDALYGAFFILAQGGGGAGAGLTRSDLNKLPGMGGIQVYDDDEEDEDEDPRYRKPGGPGGGGGWRW